MVVNQRHIIVNYLSKDSHRKYHCENLVQWLHLYLQIDVNQMHENFDLFRFTQVLLNQISIVRQQLIDCCMEQMCGFSVVSLPVFGLAFSLSSCSSFTVFFLYFVIIYLFKIKEISCNTIYDNLL